MKFGCSIGIFLNSANLICRSTDISKCFRGSLRLRDNESRLYIVLKFVISGKGGIILEIQSALVISTSVISNNCLSRRENLVLVFTQKSKIRLQNIAEQRRNLSPFPQYFQYIILI